MASNSYTLEVIANTAKYQTELARIPGLTEKQAAAAALKMAQAQEKAQQQMAASAEKASRQAADSQIDAMDEVADAAEATARRQSEAAEKAADGFGKVGESAGKLGGVLEMLGVEGASTIADLADAGEVAAQAFGGLGIDIAAVGAALGPVAVVVGLVGAAMWVMADAASASSAAMEESKVKAEELKVALDAVNEAHKQTTATFKDNANSLAVATGGLEDYELAASNAAEAVRDGIQSEINARTLAIMETQRQLALAQVAAETGSAQEGVKAEGIKNSNALTASLKQQQRELENLIYITDVQAGKAHDAVIAEHEAKNAKDETTASAKGAAKATISLIDAEKARADALAQLLALETAARSATLSPLEQILESQRQQIEQVRTLEKASGDQMAAAAAEGAIRLATSQQVQTIYGQELAALQAIGEQAQATAEIKLQADLDNLAAHTKAAAEALKADNASQEELTALYEQSLQKRAALIDQYNQEAKDSHREAMAEVAANIADTFSASVNTYANSLEQIARATSDRLSDEANNLTEAERAQLERRLEAQKKAATAGFRIQQAAEIAQATMSTVKGATEAFNSVFATVPYPANLVLAPITAGVVAAAGAAQVAAIASQAPPKFHVGSVGATSGASGSGEFLAVLQGGEGVIPRQAMTDAANRNAVATMRAGGTVGGSSLSASDITDGMNRSATPRLLLEILGTLTRIEKGSGLSLPPPRSRNPRPGHKVVYA